jgi:hypothetical protein
MSVQANALYQPLSQMNSETILSRITKHITLKNVAVIAIGASTIAAITTYLLTQQKHSDTNSIFPHGAAFSYYCRESCKILYCYNPLLAQECSKYCEGSSKDTFPKACILACNKLGTDVLLKCIQSCK